MQITWGCELVPWRRAGACLEWLPSEQLPAPQYLNPSTSSPCLLLKLVDRFLGCPVCRSETLLFRSTGRHCSGSGGCPSGGFVSPRSPRGRPATSLHAPGPGCRRRNDDTFVYFHREILTRATRACKISALGYVEKLSSIPSFSLARPASGAPPPSILARPPNLDSLRSASGHAYRRHAGHGVFAVPTFTLDFQPTQSKQLCVLLTLQLFAFRVQGSGGLTGGRGRVLPSSATFVGQGPPRWLTGHGGRV